MTPIPSPLYPTAALSHLALAPSPPPPPTIRLVFVSPVASSLRRSLVAGGSRRSWWARGGERWSGAKVRSEVRRGKKARSFSLAWENNPLYAAPTTVRLRRAARCDKLHFPAINSIRRRAAPLRSAHFSRRPASCRRTRRAFPSRRATCAPTARPVSGLRSRTPRRVIHVHTRIFAYA